MCKGSQDGRLRVGKESAEGRKNFVRLGLQVGRPDRRPGHVPQGASRHGFTNIHLPDPVEGGEKCTLESHELPSGRAAVFKSLRCKVKLVVGSVLPSPIGRSPWTGRRRSPRRPRPPP